MEIMPGMESQNRFLPQHHTAFYQIALGKDKAIAGIITVAHAS
jgi:hypothetical protein